MYELIQAGENTFYITCPAQMGIYRLPDDKVILIDSGNDAEAGKKVLKLLQTKNWTLQTIINTHANADHIGGNKLLFERTGCQIFAPDLEAAAARHPMLEPSLLYGGYPPKALRNKFLLAAPSPCSDINSVKLPAGLELIDLPGHFLQMIGVRTPDEVIFLADCLTGEKVLEKYHFSFIYDVEQYLRTLDLVAALQAKLFVPAHAAATEDIRLLVQKNQQKTAEIIEKILFYCQKPIFFEELLKALYDEYQLSLDFNQYVLAGSTLRSYLAYLADQGRIGYEFAQNRLLWRTISNI